MLEVSVQSRPQSTTLAQNPTQRNSSSVSPTRVFNHQLNPSSGGIDLYLRQHPKDFYLGKDFSQSNSQPSSNQAVAPQHHNTANQQGQSASMLERRLPQGSQVGSDQVLSTSMPGRFQQPASQSEAGSVNSATEKTAGISTASEGEFTGIKMSEYEQKEIGRLAYYFEKLQRSPSVKSEHLKGVIKHLERLADQGFNLLQCVEHIVKEKSKNGCTTADSALVTRMLNELQDKLSGAANSNGRRSRSLGARFKVLFGMKTGPSSSKQENLKQLQTLLEKELSGHNTNIESLKNINTTPEVLWEDIRNEILKNSIINLDGRYDNLFHEDTNFWDCDEFSRAVERAINPPGVFKYELRDLAARQFGLVKYLNLDPLDFLINNPDDRLTNVGPGPMYEGIVEDFGPNFERTEKIKKNMKLFRKALDHLNDRNVNARERIQELSDSYEQLFSGTISRESDERFIQAIEGTIDKKNRVFKGDDFRNEAVSLFSLTEGVSFERLDGLITMAHRWASEADFLDNRGVIIDAHGTPIEHIISMVTSLELFRDAADHARSQAMQDL